MRHRPIRKVQILALMAVLVVATGMTAAPVRNALTPLIAHPFGLRLGHAPTASTGVLVTEQSARAEGGRDIELDDPIGLPAPLAYSSNGGHSAEDHLAKAEDAAESASGDRSGSRRGGRLIDTYAARRQNGRLSGGSYSFSRDVVGSRVGAGTTGKSDSADTRQSPSRSSSPSPAGGGTAAPPKNDKPKDPAGLFNEHTSGLTDLDGHKASKDGPAGKMIGGASVAVNPEPSSLLLFGTGIAFVAGAIRKRLR